MATEERGRERDLILGNGEFAFIQDTTKGNINVYVGSYKASLSATDQPVFFNTVNERFESCSLEKSKAGFINVKQNSYVMLENPEGNLVFPKLGTVNNSAELLIGKKVNITGPTSFALWPGQTATIVEGHKLKSNQYLLVRVYDEEAAKANWNKATIATEDDTIKEVFDIAQIRLGKLFIIKGTDVSFYIPPTGIEVLKNEHNSYVRNAVTLERLECCILLDENGNKRFEKGPAVVFPTSTETFVLRDSNPKFKAIELSDIKGIYIKVIADYKENGKEYKEGDELFITGRDQKIYYPRAEHAIIKYGRNEVQYAVTIPEGEGRYVLDRNTGVIKTVTGPDIFMPDPRKEILVKRILTPNQVKLWFPGNEKALKFNEDMMNNKAAKIAYASARTGKSYQRDSASVYANPSELNKQTELDDYSGTKQSGSMEENFSDSFDRSSAFAPPPTITLDTKYDGAIQIDVWNGYVVQTTLKNGERKTHVGPKHVLLDFDEVIEEFNLPDGTKTVYVPLESRFRFSVNTLTKDNEEARVVFNVQYITDTSKLIPDMYNLINSRLNSFFVNNIAKLTSEEIFENREKILNDFNYDLIEGIKIQFIEILQCNPAASNSDLINVFKNRIKSKRDLSNMKAVEKESAELDSLKIKKEKEKLDNELEILKKKLEIQNFNKEMKKNDTEFELENTKKVLERESLINDLKLSLKKEENAIDLERAEKENQLAIDKAKVLTPDLIETLKKISEEKYIMTLVKELGLESYLKDSSVKEILTKKLSGTNLNLDQVLKKLTD